MTSPSQNRILNFIHGDSLDVLQADLDVPRTGAVVVVHYNDELLLVHNLKRNQWECPGGGIEPGETPLAAARREVMEETGQVLTAVEQVGWLKVYIALSAQEEYFACFTGQIAELVPFAPNAEIDRIMLWRPGDLLDGPHGKISRAMIDIVTQA